MKKNSDLGDAYAKSVVEVRLTCAKHGILLNSHKTYKRGICECEIEPCIECIREAKQLIKISEEAKDVSATM